MIITVTPCTMLPTPQLIQDTWLAAHVIPISYYLALQSSSHLGTSLQSCSPILLSLQFYWLIHYTQLGINLIIKSLDGFFKMRNNRGPQPVNMCLLQFQRHLRIRTFSIAFWEMSEFYRTPLHPEVFDALPTLIVLKFCAGRGLAE